MLQILLDTLFPIKCIAGCGAWNTWICDACLNPAIEPSVIDQTKQNSLYWGIKKIYGVGKYHHPIMQSAIQEMKYGGARDIGIKLGKALAYIIPPNKYDYVVPVPLHKRRFRERGFNQSNVIAEQLTNITTTLLPALTRNRYTTAQASLDREHRLNNLKSAFVINPRYKSLIMDKKILIVDDVFTTGSTINTCAQILYQNNAQLVDGAVIAID